MRARRERKETHNNQPTPKFEHLEWSYPVGGCGRVHFSVQTVVLVHRETGGQLGYLYTFLRNFVGCSCDPKSVLPSCNTFWYLVLCCVLYLVHSVM